MNIKKNRIDNCLTLSIEGKLETTTAPELEAVIKNELDDVGVLILDFSGLEYISSAGLRVLLVAQKKMNLQGKMKITGANENVIEIFDMTGFSDILIIE